MMERDERQLLIIGAWLFARHGQGRRARILLEALAEADPRDGVVAAVLAGLLLDGGLAESALATLRAAEMPPRLARAGAMLETRALRALGREEDAAARWRRYLNAAKGSKREWIAQTEFKEDRG